ncbi:MAG: hypothetical protein K0R82_2992, partial [Flavipsychrobacter sp.]|nr:hypothetical protein [Flavipsychrobacter sp.]
MRLPYVVLLLLVAVTTQAQNLVPNGSFEQYTTCPTGISQANNCVGWRQYTGASTDYFNSCNATMIPVVLQGWQYPAQGNAFMGFYTFSSNSPTIYKEYIATTIPALVPGSLYEVSISLSLANNSSYASNDIGVYFYDVGPLTISGNNVVPVIPQVSYTSYGPVTDTQNWVRLTNTFLADSTYDNIVIGGFKGWTGTNAFGSNDTVRVKPTGNPLSYYYLDSIVIKLIDTLSFTYNDTLLCIGDSIIAPFTASGTFFASNNVFTLQLSDASGSFASPTTIATLAGTSSGILRGIVPGTVTGGSGYKLRIVASNPSKTVTNPKNIAIGLSTPVKPVAVGNNPVCGGNTLFLTATTTTTGVTWQWTGPASFTSATQNPTVPNFVPANAGNYIVTALNFGCEAKDTVTITYQPGLIALNATNSSPVCEGAGFTLSTTSSTTGVTYSWTGPNSYTSNVQNPSVANSTVNMSGDYVVTD